MRDEQIVQMLWKRNEDAINQMKQSYGNYCYSISYHIVGNREDADECLNDTWFATWNSIPNKRPPSLKAYVGKIIRNLSLNRIIHDHACKRGAGEVDVVYHEAEEMLGGADPIDHMIDEQAFSEILNTFLNGLSEEYRNIFVLRFWYFFSPQEIAQKCQMKEKAVYNILFRLKKQFKAYWTMSLN